MKIFGYLLKSFDFPAFIFYPKSHFSREYLMNVNLIKLTSRDFWTEFSRTFEFIRANFLQTSDLNFLLLQSREVHSLLKLKFLESDMVEWWLNNGHTEYADDLRIIDNNFIVWIVW